MNSDKTKELLIEMEGWLPQPQRDSDGKLNLGFGFNLTDYPLPWEVAIYWLEYIILDCVEDLVSIFPKFAEFSDNWQTALIDMRYNLGPRKFRKFTDMIAAINRGDGEAAARECLDSIRGRKLKRRSKIDAELLRGG